MNESQGISIDYAKLIKSIQYQFSNIIYENNLKITLFVDDEQNFLKRTDIVPNAIYIVIHFGEAAIDWASSVCSVSLKVLGTEGTLEPARNLLNLFSSNYNMQYVKYYDEQQEEEVTDEGIIQTWRIPTITSNFVETDSNFRNLFSCSGSYVISESLVNFSISGIKYKYGEGDDDWETINYLRFSDSYSASPEPQPFYSSNAFSKTEIKFGTYSFNFTTYMISNHLITDIFKLTGFTNYAPEINTNFTFKLTFGSGGNTFTKEANFKCISATRNHNRGEATSINLSFTM